jgi:pimeloyl-ACP methyl ester carboxylesterase
VHKRSLAASVVAVTTTHQPGVLDALSLLSQVADELVVRTVRDTHVAWVDRVHGLLRRPRGPGARPGPGERLHRGIADGVYAGLGGGLRAVSRGLGAAADHGVGPRLEADPRGRFLTAAVNGLIGDRLERERPRMAIPMAVRRDGADVALDAPSLAAAFPDASGRVVVFLHGLCESEAAWDLHRERRGATYPETLAGDGWTPVLLRANSGLPLRENGVALTSLLERLVADWPVPVEQVALVGHSMGGLVMRAAAAVVAGDHPPAWVRLVTDVVTLGTPHLGAPLAWQVGTGSTALGRLPESAAFGRILDWRSDGVRDLVHGLAEDVAPLPHARYHLVSATLTRSPRHPVGAALGDLLVRVPSAYGRSRGGRTLFPDADVLHVGGVDHFGLLNHPDVERALRDWLR